MSNILQQHLQLHNHNASNINKNNKTNRKHNNKQSTIGSGYIQSLYKTIAERAKKYTVTQHNLAILTGVNQGKQLKKQHKLAKSIVNKQNKQLHIRNKYNKHVKPSQVGLDKGRKYRVKERTTLHNIK